VLRDKHYDERNAQKLLIAMRVSFVYWWPMTLATVVFGSLLSTQSSFSIQQNADLKDRRAFAPTH
jgi:hypothetical protein